MGDEEAPPDQTRHTEAFAEFQEASGATSAEDQERVRTAHVLVDHLMHVSDEELVLLHQVGIASIDTEMARRNLEATRVATAATGHLQTSITDLQRAADSWRRWLIGLTVALGCFTLALVGVMFALGTLTAVQMIVAVVEARG